MRVACVNQDRGVGPKRQKGAAIHLDAMRVAFEELGCEVLRVDTADPKDLRERLERGWGEKDYDFIYERYALGGSEASRFAREHAVPHVLEVNAPLAQEEQRWRVGGRGATEPGASDRHVFENAELVIAVSQQVADYARVRGANPSCVRVFANGVDTRRFKPRVDADLRNRLVPPGRFALGLHGRLRPWHGFERFVRMAATLLASGADIHLVLVGKGDFHRHLQGKLPDDRVTRVPWVDHAQVGDFVATFDCLPLTYPPDLPCYFSPLKLAEAMACRVVPVAPRMGDLADVVEDGVNGLLYDAAVEQTLTRQVRRLIEDPELHGKLGNAALRSARGMSWERVASFVLEDISTRAVQ